MDKDTATLEKVLKYRADKRGAHIPLVNSKTKDGFFYDEGELLYYYDTPSGSTGAVSQIMRIHI